MIDAHLHIHDPSFDSDREAVLIRAKRVGVEAMISAGVNLGDSIKCLEVSRKFPEVFPAVGLHPTEDLSQIDGVLNLVESSPDIVAVGEIGLDYAYQKRPEQIEPFRKQVSLAMELDLPVVVHSRSAGRYVLEILEAMKAERVLLHGFDGSLKLIKKVVDLGYFVSVPVTVVKSEYKQRLVEALPVDNLLLETDSPVLNPFGGRNEPANLIYGLKKISEIKGIEPKELEKITDRNAKSLFRIKIG